MLTDHRFEFVNQFSWEAHENSLLFFLEKIHQASAAAARAKKLQKPRVARQPVSSKLQKQISPGFHLFSLGTRVIVYAQRLTRCGRNLKALDYTIYTLPNSFYTATHKNGCGGAISVTERTWPRPSRKWSVRYRIGFESYFGAVWTPIRDRGGSE